MKYQCVFCKSLFRDWRDLTRHTQEMHHSRRIWKCRQCRYQTTHEGDFERHRLRMHDRRDARRHDAENSRPRGSGSSSRPRPISRERSSREENRSTKKKRTSPPPSTVTAPPPSPPHRPEAVQLADETFIKLHPSPAANLERAATPAPTLESGPPLCTADLMALMDELISPLPESRQDSPATTRKVPSPLPPEQAMEVPPTPASPTPAPTCPMDEWLTAIDAQIEALLPPPPSEPTPAAPSDAPPLRTDPPASEDKTSASAVTAPVGPSNDAAEETPARPEQANPPMNLPANDPRFVRNRRQTPPRSAAGAEVDWMRHQARTDPNAERRRRDVLHPIDFGVTVRLVTESATFPDGRAFSIQYTEYVLPSKAVNPREWTTPELHRRHEM